MSTPPGQGERKVRQFDNDVQSIYEMLAGLEATQCRHGNHRVGEIDRRHGDTHGKLDRILGLLERGPLSCAAISGLIAASAP